MLLPPWHTLSEQFPSQFAKAADAFSKHFCLQLIDQNELLTTTTVKNILMGITVVKQLISQNHLNIKKTVQFIQLLILHNFDLDIIININMKLLIAVLITLAILQVYAQKEIDSSRTPLEQLKKLEEIVRFKKATSDYQMNNNKKGGFFGSLFGGDNAEDVTKSLREQNEQGSDNQLKINQNLDRFSQLMNSLPYEALLPRRRRPLSFLNKALKGQQDSSDQSDDPLKELDRLLSINKKKKNKKMHWQNPEFKEGSRDAPFMKIFGPKSKLKHRIQINEQNIHKLLVQSVPSLKGGNILKMSFVPHRKGIFLNIEYETVKEQIYTIKAKYLRKANQIEIISMTQINVLRKIDDDDEDSNQEVEITVAKPQVVNIPVEKVQQKVAQNTKAQVKIEEKKEDKKLPKVQNQKQPKHQDKKQAKDQKKNQPKEEEKNKPKQQEKINTKVQEKIEQKAIQKVEDLKPSQEKIPAQTDKETQNSSDEQEQVQQQQDESLPQQSSLKKPVSNLSQEPKNENPIETN